MKNKIKEGVEIADSISRYIRGDYSEDDKQKIKIWLNKSPHNKALLKSILNKKNISDHQSFIKCINNDIEWNQVVLKTEALRKKQRSISILKYAAAILFPLLLVTYFFSDIVPLNNKTAINQQKITPGIRKAKLILNDGNEILLTDKRQYINTSSIDISIKADSQQLSYSLVDTTNIAGIPDTTFNRLIVGRGEEYQIKLSDGTKVWLNSESELVFPTRFSDSEREVKLTGEGYFEVVHNKKVPFIVKTGSISVQVLGTSFNISAYKGDETIKTTLLKGRVEIIQQKADKEYSVVLKPDDQAIYDNSSKNLIVKVVDASMYASWTKGYFAFEDESLYDIMNKLAKWYDFDFSFQYPHLKKFQFSGKLPRFEDANVLFGMIEKTTDVKFKTDKNGTVIITDADKK